MLPAASVRPRIVAGAGGAPKRMTSLSKLLGQAPHGLKRHAGNQQAEHASDTAVLVWYQADTPVACSFQNPEMTDAVGEPRAWAGIP